MSTDHPRWRRRAAALVAVLAAGALLGTGPATARPVAPATASATVLAPAVVPATREVPNAERGQYRWMGYAGQPAGWPATDLYYRDQVYWGRIEPTAGAYDFSWLDAGLADAGAQRAKFGFRVMAYCPGCWMESRPDLPTVTPSFVPFQPGTTVPDWNSDAFLTRWEALWAELGRRYADDPRLGWVDVGGVGAYGEWGPAGTDPMPAAAQRVVDAVANAFPHTHVLLSAVPFSTRPQLVTDSVAAHPNLGFRSDCLGQAAMQVPTAPFADLWRTRPFHTEWCSGGDPVLARQQVATHHVSTVSSGNLRLTWATMTAAQRSAYVLTSTTSGYRYAATRVALSPVVPRRPFTVTVTLANLGVAPTYDPWTVRLVLKDAGGARVATYPMGVDLRGVLPGSRAVTRSFPAPDVAPGTYTVALEVLDPSGYLAPMALASGSRAADGAYVLGRVAVRASTSTWR